MNYSLHQLRIFMKVIETKSISRAAEELHLTQPAISIQMKNLQDQFELPLTEVIGRKLYITDFGMEIAESAKLILDEVEEIRIKALSYKGQLAGKLKVSVASTGKYVMPYFLSGFQKLHNDIEIIMDVTNKSLVMKSLEQNEVDFALVSVIPDNIDLETEKLMPNRLYMVGSKEFHATSKREAEKLLQRWPFIYREPGSATRAAMEEFISSKHLPVTKKIELTSNEAVKQAVLSGLGLTLMPIIGLKNELLNDQLDIIPISGLPLKTTWNLIWLKQKKFSPVAAAYLEYVREQKTRIMEEQFKWFESY